MRVGIVGAGYIAAVHSAAYRTVSGTFPEAPRDVSLSAVADTDARRAEQLQTAWGWERREADWRALTRADDIDVVDVCVPNALHAEIAIDALRHGKHVVCEKPLAHDAASARLMCEAAAQATGIAQVCFYYRLWPAIAWAAEIVRSGQLGTLRHFRGWMLQDYAARHDHALGWRTDRALAGAGALGDLGSHIIDIARHLCGPIARVNAMTQSFVSRPGGIGGIDDAAVLLVEFKDGPSGVIEASWAMHGHKCDLGFDLVGERGAVRFSWERANEVEVLLGDPYDELSGFRRVLIGSRQPDGERFAGVPGQGLGYRDAFAIGLGHLVAAIERQDSTVSPSFEDGLSAALVVGAALESAASDQWIDVGAGTRLADDPPASAGG